MVQILVVSVLNPALLIRYTCGWAANYGSEKFAQLSPDFDYDRFIARFVAGYRAANIVIAVAGLFMLGWLTKLVRQPDWVTAVVDPLVWFFLLQMAPLALTALYAVVRYRKLLLQPSQEVKRKATLQRRGLFDFVSPFAVYFALASYVLFVVVAIYLDLNVYKNTSLSRHCISALIGVTLIYAANAFVIYKYLYGRRNPLVTQEARVHTIGVRVKGGIYSSIAIAWFISIFGILGQPGLTDWRPFRASSTWSPRCWVSWISPRHRAGSTRTQSNPAFRCNKSRARSTNKYL
jgi:hypothetical protein